LALTSYNDSQLESQRQAYNTFFEIGYSIRRHAPKYIIALALGAVALPGTPIFWMFCALTLFTIDTNRRLRMQDPFGKGKGPYIKRVPGAKKTTEEWSVISTPQHRGGDGIWPMGNNFYTNEEVVAADTIVRTHMVLSGTTGSGKTVTMTSAFAYTAFVSSSGMCMIDGKADPKTWFDLFAMAVAAGRADDFLVLNFVVGAAQQAEYSFYSKAQRALWEEFRAVESNTFNIFGTGNSDTLFEIGASLLGSEASGENKMWVERAEALLRSLLKGLTDLRDKGRIKISVKALQEYMSLEKLSDLENDPDIDKTAREQISAVLNEIPGYRDAMSIDDPQQRSMALADQPSKQFGFLLMQFSALFAMLIGTYGHIANVQYSDIYFPDVVYGRRILLCQLPALEKSPNTMAQLGRMALSGIKSALSQSISGTLSGRKADIVDRRPTNSLRAMLLIYDEAGSYLQAGTADVASQARSLGVFNIFSGQEWASFKSAGDLEAQRIISNSGLKTVLKTEDKETCDEFINAVGETHVLRSGGQRLDNGRWYEDQRQLDKIPRVTGSQIANLAEGQAFLKWRDTLVPLRMPFVEAKPVVKAQRNDLVPIPGSMVSDRDKMRENRVITQEIIQGAKPAINLVAECRVGLQNANDEAEGDSWRLMERLVRYAHQHQVILPWEECPPPQGRLHASEIHAIDPIRGARALDYLLRHSREEHELLTRARAIVENGRSSTPPYNPQEMALESAKADHANAGNAPLDSDIADISSRVDALLDDDGSEEDITDEANTAHLNDLVDDVEEDSDDGEDEHESPEQRSGDSPGNSDDNIHDGINFDAIDSMVERTLTEKGFKDAPLDEHSSALDSFFPNEVSDPIKPSEASDAEAETPTDGANEEFETPRVPGFAEFEAGEEPISESLASFFDQDSHSNTVETMEPIGEINSDSGIQENQPHINNPESTPADSRDVLSFLDEAKPTLNSARKKLTDL